MAFLGRTELEALLPKCIDGYESSRLENVAYSLCLGSEAYLTDSTSGKKELLGTKNPQVVIKPGQFALLLTKETIAIPTDILAFISIKFSQKIKGLINVSGFHVDPGFKGKIIFSVYNAGPATIVLDRDKPYFLIWFSELTSSSNPYEGKHNNQQEITADHISAIQGDLASPKILLERIKSNENSLTNIKWAAGIVIALGIALMGIGVTFILKSSSDASKFNEGYNNGIKERRTKELIDSTFDKANIESIISNRVDAYLKTKQIPK